MNIFQDVKKTLKLIDIFMKNNKKRFLGRKKLFKDLKTMEIIDL